MALTFSKKKHVNEDVVLQITSMADIFMILLVFLLKNYSANIANIAPTEETKLPISSSQTPLQEAFKVEISSNAIMVDQKAVAKLTRFHLDEGAVGLKSLEMAFQQERKRHSGEKEVSTLLVLADEHTPYETLRTVMASAALSGFVDLQLVVAGDQ